jgi:hypothetical protein
MNGQLVLVDVALWPEAADPGCPLYRRYQGNSGSDVDIAKPTQLTLSRVRQFAGKE